MESIARARQGLDAAEEVGYQRGLAVTRSLGAGFRLCARRPDWRGFSTAEVIQQWAARR